MPTPEQTPLPEPDHDPTVSPPREVAAIINDAASAQLNMDLMRRMATLQLLKKHQDQQLKETKREIATIQEACLNELTAAGVERLPMRVPEGTITLYVHTQMWARPIGGAEGRPAVVEVLRSEGMTDFIKTDFNVQQLSGFARECERSDLPLPEALQAVLELNNTVEIRSRQS